MTPSTFHESSLQTTIIGAGGYTGVELVRLLLRHPQAKITQLLAASKAGQEMAGLYPHLHGTELPSLKSLDEADWQGVDVVFCCLPHGTSQEIIASLPEHVKIIDLSADFRLESLESYHHWYGHPHQAPNLQKEAVYGLVEHARERIKNARLIANPGCYPTSILLPLLPLIAAQAIDTGSIIADAKSGVTGAGRSAKEANLYAEVAENVHAYSVGNHRHTPEIEQELSKAAGLNLEITFTPHLMPMSRGIFSTIYVQSHQSVEAIHALLAKTYNNEPFVEVLPLGQLPATRGVRGSNYTHIGVAKGRRPGQIVLLSAIDNLVKGASGQAVQNMNVLFGLPETMGLEQLAMMP
jgi:N-acetyl-gamma-glutamyl-phosphate reductase